MVPGGWKEQHRSCAVQGGFGQAERPLQDGTAPAASGAGKGRKKGTAGSPGNRKMLRPKGHPHLPRRLAAACADGAPDPRALIFLLPGPPPALAGRQPRKVRRAGGAALLPGPLPF